MPRSSISGLPRALTSQKAKVRSRPRNSKENYFLDLYVINMEKARIEQELGLTLTRKKNLEADLAVLKKEIEKIEGTISKLSPGSGSDIQPGGCGVKKMVMDY
ncbi:MAG: hypothetical protein NUW09_11085 [Deltaproteobacteria bacterium]|nr:hypothetical protein [Deltaproteobacteria bacterium]